MLKHYKITVCGHITHKGYRFRTLHTARQLSIRGTVSEMPGCIVVDAEGEEPKLKQLVSYFRELPAIDPPLVIEVDELPMMYYDEFRII